jgi:hypothetical protein
MTAVLADQRELTSSPSAFAAFQLGHFLSAFAAFSSSTKKTILGPVKRLATPIRFSFGLHLPAHFTPAIEPGPDKFAYRNVAFWLSLSWTVAKDPISRELARLPFMGNCRTYSIKSVVIDAVCKSDEYRTLMLHRTRFLISTR